jgi:ParB family chromosome partitioning protein
MSTKKRNQKKVAKATTVVEQPVTAVEQPVNEEQSVIEQSTTEQSVTEEQSAIEQPVSVEQSVIEKSETEQSVTEEEPAIEQPVSEEQSVIEQSETEQSVTEEQSAIEQPVSVEQSVIEQSETEQSVTEEQPAIEQSADEQPVSEQSTLELSSEKPKSSSQTQVIDIRIDAIIPSPMNPRRYYDGSSLAELAQNIREHGVLQPVTVREIPEYEGRRKYELIFGERRFRAAIIAENETIPCMVRNISDDAAFDLMISENLQRQDIRPSEEGEAFKRIIEKGKDIRYISERFGKSETFIHSRISLVRLIPSITKLLDSEEITIGQGFEISKLEPDLQESLYKEHLITETAINN